MHFQQNFINWTSGNNDIDKFIQVTQLSVHNNYEISNALEWIPYDRFCDIKYIAKGFDEIYRTKWIDGFIDGWDIEHQIWKRKDQNMFIILKSLNNLKNITYEFLNKVFLIYCKSLDITQDLLFYKNIKI
jgi:hypothetical protein